MAGLLRKERRDGDYHKTMFQTRGGGREGMRGEVVMGAGMLTELLRSLGKWRIGYP